MSRHPAPPSGFSMTDLRRGVVTVGPHDGTQERRRKRLAFRQALIDWIDAGGVCDLLDKGNLECSTVSSLPEAFKRLALGEGPPRTVKVAAGQSAPAGLFQTFASEEPMFSPDEDGYCYLSFVRADARNHAVDALGYNPWSPCVAGWLLENPSLHSTGSYKAELGPSAAGSGFTQMHVTQCKGGLTWHEALRLGPINTRVGAAPGLTMATAMQAAEADGPRTVLEVRPRGAGIAIPVPFGFSIATATGGDRVRWSPATSRGLAKLIQYFESVELMSLQMAVIVHEGGPTTLLRMAITPLTDPPASDVGWVSASHAIMLSGNAQTGTAAELSLPANHQFGRQLKGVNLGNPAPCIHAFLTSPTSAYAFVKGLLTVRVTGSGLPDAILVGTIKHTAAQAVAIRRRVSPANTVTGASISGATAVESEGGEEESEDDE